MGRQRVLASSRGPLPGCCNAFAATAPPVAQALQAKQQQRSRQTQAMGCHRWERCTPSSSAGDVLLTA